MMLNCSDVYPKFNQRLRYTLHKLIPERLPLQYYSTKSTKFLMDVCCAVTIGHGTHPAAVAQGSFNGLVTRWVLHCCMLKDSMIPVQVVHPGLPHWQLSPQLQLAPHLHGSTTQSRMKNSPDSLCILHQVSQRPTNSNAWHAARVQSAYPQLALPHGFLAVHSCGLHLHWPGGHLQLSPQAGHPMLSPVIREVTPCHSGTTAKVAWETRVSCSACATARSTANADVYWGRSLESGIDADKRTEATECHPTQA